MGFPAAIREAKGALPTDVDGNRFIDLAGGVSVLNVGHSDPGVVGAAEEQPGRFVHTEYTVAPYALYGEVAEQHSGHGKDLSIYGLEDYVRIKKHVVTNLEA